MLFWIGLGCGLVAGTFAGAMAIVAALGLLRGAIDEIRGFCAGLADQLGEPTEDRGRSRTL